MTTQEHISPLEDVATSSFATTLEDNVPSEKVLGKRKAEQQDRVAEEILGSPAPKRPREAAHEATAVPTSSRVIVPCRPKSPSPTLDPPEEEPEEPDEGSTRHQHAAGRTAEADIPIPPETYEILPPAQRINPATTLEELLIRSRAQYSNITIAKDEDDLLHDFFYLPPPLRPEAGPSSTSIAAGNSGVVDLTDATTPPPSPSSSDSSDLPLPPLGGSGPPGSGGVGSSLTSAIVIQDSPTPPLRPLASPMARMEATANGRCGVLGGSGDSETSPEKDEEKVTLGELVCPICLGPPTPLVFTECGHAFCGPCLHSALISQPVTHDTLRSLPDIAGKELEGTCAVCRHPLAGGWGKALRGAILRMAEVEVPC